MLNPEPPPQMVNPPATPLNRETTSLRKRQRVRIPVPPLAEVVEAESSWSPMAKSSKATKQNDGVSTPVEVIDLSDNEDDDDDDDDVRILKFTPTRTCFGKRRKAKGECSNAAAFVCEICAETKRGLDAFSIAGCCHVYCKECVGLYIESKVEENVVNIGCPVPRCRGLLEAEDCREILAPGVLERWGKALCEAVICAEEKFYCPFADCSALLIRGSEDEIRESECPNCRRLFCAMCRVPWHTGIPCEEFQKLNADETQNEDIMLMNLANQMMWKRCPTCMFYVAKSHGCMYIKCRCGTAFCYNCGSLNLTSSHCCPYCRR
ncbi:hypothetical protein VNO78_03251 [Psophocarpus tetragonolobus]|uniref:RBR-type E3 ubiquitin transferase n=1 Tax=Psophocarpus tetragonolobus TaxID=3891 RepID=A0AAN9XVF6_PSOTE